MMLLGTIEDAMRQGDTDQMKEILQDRGPAFVRMCLRHALCNDLTQAAHWFLELGGYRTGSRLFQVMAAYGHRQSNLGLWDAMVSRLWPFRQNRRIRFRTQPLKAIHLNLVPAFVARGLI